MCSISAVLWHKWAFVGWSKRARETFYHGFYGKMHSSLFVTDTQFVHNWGAAQKAFSLKIFSLSAVRRRDLSMGGSKYDGSLLLFRNYHTYWWEGGGGVLGIFLPFDFLTYICEGEKGSLELDRMHFSWNTGWDKALRSHQEDILLSLLLLLL